jgi:hypothetical protein
VILHNSSLELGYLDSCQEDEYVGKIRPQAALWIGMIWPGIQSRGWLYFNIIIESL